MSRPNLHRDFAVAALLEFLFSALTFGPDQLLAKNGLLSRIGLGEQCHLSKNTCKVRLIPEATLVPDDNAVFGVRYLGFIYATKPRHAMFDHLADGYSESSAQMPTIRL
ncbi:hypothetical protein BD769DRAFT_1674135 [Suillus cothurnatus]|nr:hypothetical protein BD769DRAFT_1674135 [Suillus cothurnatus]